MRIQDLARQLRITVVLPDTDAHERRRLYAALCAPNLFTHSLWATDPLKGRGTYESPAHVCPTIADLEML